MFRYKLRTLLIVLALGPPVLAYFIAVVLAVRDAAVQARTHKITVTTRLLLGPEKMPSEEP